MEVGVQNQAGSDAITIRLSRDKRGILVRVRVAPEVEDFFRRWGGERQENVREFGALWNAPAAGEKLHIWMIPQKVGRGAYILNQPGTELLPDAHAAQQAAARAAREGGRLVPPEPENPFGGQPQYARVDIANISCIQLVGASQGDGVSFTIDTAASRPELAKAADLLQYAASTFYTDYIKPVNMEVAVVSRPTGGNF